MTRLINYRYGWTETRTPLGRRRYPPLWRMAIAGLWAWMIGRGK